MKRTETLQAIIDGFSQFKRAIHGHYHDTFAKLNLSPAQMELLHVIKQSEPVSHKALAAKLQLTPGAVSQLLDGLDRADCISRTPSPSDRRVSYVALSRAGKRKLEELHVMRKKLFTAAFDTLDESELDTYLQVQQKLITWLETHQPPNKK